MNYDASKNSVEKTTTKRADSDQVGKMLMGKDGYMPGMSGGHANVVESSKVGKWRVAAVLLTTVAVIVVVAIIVTVLNSMRVDYAGSYKIAKEIKAKVQEMRADENCKKVVSNADLDYVKMETYMGYVDACQNLTTDIATLNENLGKTEGVRRNGNIASAYNDYVASFVAVQEGDEVLAQNLSYYRAWHEWVLAQEKLEGWDGSDTDLSTAVKSLTESGNTELKAYGQSWLTKKMKANKAYREFHYSDILASNRSELLKTMNTAQKEFADWLAKNSLDIKTVVGVARADNAKVYTDFDLMYSLIKENYEKNYNHGSGDCLETLTDVVCD